MFRSTGMLKRIDCSHNFSINSCWYCHRNNTTTYVSGCPYVRMPKLGE